MALCAISRIADSICEEPAATVSTLEATPPAEATTTSACWAAVRAFSRDAVGRACQLLRGGGEPDRRVVDHAEDGAERVERVVQRRGHLAELAAAGAAGAHREVTVGDLAEDLAHALYRAGSRCGR